MIRISNFVRIVDADGCRFVLVCDQLFYHYVLGNRDEEAFIIAVLARGGQAGVRELARAFEVDEKTVYRYRRRLEKSGAAGIPQRKRGPKGPSIATATFRKRALALREQGHSASGVGRILGVSHTLINRILREEGWQPATDPSLIDLDDDEEESRVTDEEVAEPLASPVEQEPKDCVEEAGTASRQDVDAVGDDREKGPAKNATRESTAGALPRPVAEAVSPRNPERSGARRGEIEEAPPLLESGTNLRCTGAFLALPGLIEVGLLAAAHSVYRRLRNGFYGLRSTIMTLFLMATLRIKSPEGLTDGLPPEVLGRILGLDRSPEVKTVRRKLRELSSHCRAADFVTELARQIRREHEDLLGFLYVDGHVRAYYGKKKLSKTWVATRRLCLPATTEIWVNDAEGDPFFFVTTEGNPALSQALPDVMSGVRGILGPGRRAVVIFDRGGWSAKAMKELQAMDFDFVTYRRRPYEDLADELFEEVEIEPEKAVDLAEGEIQVKSLGKVRVVARRDPDGTQVHVLTSTKPEELSTGEVYRRVSRRWRQENFFKYAKAHYAIDSLVSFDDAAVEGEREIPNPAWKARDRVVKAKRKAVKQLTELLGEDSKDEEANGRPTLQGFKASIYAHGTDLAEARRELGEAIDARREVPRRIRIKDLGEEPEVRLEFERKVLTDTIKLAAYRVESGLANALAPHYSRYREEGRKLIQEAMMAQGDLDVSDTTVRVTLEPLSTPSRTRALESLCEILNAKKAWYPGTRLRLSYAVREAGSRAE